MPELFDFEWAVDRDGYELEHRPGAGADGGVATHILMQPWTAIKRRGGPLRYYRPRIEHPDLHRRFAALEDSAEAVLDFVNNFGFLGSMMGTADQEREDLDQVLQSRRNVAHVLKLLDQPDSDAPPAKVFNEFITPHMTARIDFSNPHRQRLQVVPRSLISAIWLSVAEEICEGVQWRKCLSCPTWFAVGKGAGTARKRFCSDKCRVAWNRRKGD